ncbi:hypothetical protein [Listeria phage LMTA-57]|uniref:Uncharacterized protein n=3 Tax=Pecentumvirus TaxID=1857844 RepID=A0A060ALN3_9CAUD|nr:hypothetical protein HH39_gp119 [Listeria phage LMSP-25]YP_009616257.1 hypothetical protein FDI77_gp119 [Listeria phage LMTA-34]YP_009793388.1 hypothetical protein QLX42_gp085 [Listeria phage LMTA-57]AIA64497.1 hypothetical protein [Listeria phage LMSP-25]AID17055.1 hypothetical protein [Listeria phage LMTA-34]AID17539.1 hypothetical protein [Listeria phage LMTA-57]
MAHLIEKLRLYKKPEEVVRGTSVKAQHIYVANDEAKSFSGAEKWAGTSAYTLTSKNEFTNVTIHSLDIRGEGGRAYQVTLNHDNNTYLCDLRETQLMETIRNVGIEAGGKLTGTYSFIADGSQKVLVRIGSDAYAKASEQAETKSRAKRIPKKELEVGGVYAPRATYLGTNDSLDLYIGDLYRNEIVDDNPWYRGYYERRIEIGERKKFSVSLNVALHEGQACVPTYRKAETTPIFLTDDGVTSLNISNQLGRLSPRMDLKSSPNFFGKVGEAPEIKTTAEFLECLRRGLEARIEALPSKIEDNILKGNLRLQNVIPEMETVLKLIGLNTTIEKPKYSASFINKIKNIKYIVITERNQKGTLTASESTDSHQFSRAFDDLMSNILEVIIVEEENN